MDFLNNIPIDTTAGFIGLGLLVIGGFMILAGFDIINIEKVTVKQGSRTWIVGIIFAVIGIVMLFPEFTSTFEAADAEVAAESMPTVVTSTTELSESFLECGDLEISSIQPPALLEGEMQLYTVVGSGFCSSTKVFLDCLAWIGKSAGIGTADGTPASVSADGKELTVYIYLEPQSDSQLGVDLGVENPGSQAAILNVEFQRNGD